MVRGAGNICYDRGFANVLLRELLLCKESCLTAVERVRGDLARHGGGLVMMLPKLKASMWRNVEDILRSATLATHKVIFLKMVSG